MNYFIEACCPNLESVRRAVQAGAGRIELCEQLEIGGVTPSREFIRRALEAAGDVPINVLIRPRGGDFVYSEEEIQQMLESIRLCREEGVNGVVIGALRSDGSVDTETVSRLVREAGGLDKAGAGDIGTVSRLVREAGGLDITFHRAFDESTDLRQALDDIAGLGIRRILTSGGCSTAYEGRFVILDLVQQAAGRISIMPGCGVRPSNIDEIAAVTGATEFHGSQLVG